MNLFTPMLERDYCCSENNPSILGGREGLTKPGLIVVGTLFSWTKANRSGRISLRASIGYGRFLSTGPIGDRIGEMCSTHFFFLLSKNDRIGEMCSTHFSKITDQVEESKAAEDSSFVAPSETSADANTQAKEETYVGLRQLKGAKCRGIGIALRWVVFCFYGFVPILFGGV